MSSLIPPASCYPYPGSYSTSPLLTNLRPNAKVPGQIPQNYEAYVPLQFNWTNLVTQVSVFLPFTLGYFANLGLTPGAIDKVVCLVVDNSYCEYDVHIQFTDGFTITIPAWEPIDVYPIITNTKAFYCWCDGPAQIFAPVGTPNPGARLCTTNVFVCNANIPPIRGKKLEKEVFFNTVLTAAGTTTYSIGMTAIGGGLATQGVIKKIILANNSTMAAAGSLLGCSISIDSVVFTQMTFYGNTAYTQNNPGLPYIIDNLNIRANQLSLTLGAVSVTSIAFWFTVVYIDHSGTAVLT